MNRREFIALFGGAAAAWPLAARAQQQATPVIGFLSSVSYGPTARHLAGFWQGLKDAGYIEGQNVAIEYRWAAGQYDQLPSLAAGLVGRRAAVIVTHGGMAPALAAKAATSTIPIVFVTGGDVVRSGLVASVNRPGGNATGVNLFTQAVEGKKLELITKLSATATIVAFLTNPNNPLSTSKIAEMQETARSVARKLIVLNASTAADLPAAFETLVQQGARLLVVHADPFFDEIGRDQIIKLAEAHQVPAIHAFREATVAGGLMSYGTSLTDAERQRGIYVGRILKGENPADLPVVQPIKFEFVINLRTAKNLGLDIPPTLLALADEVIE